MQPIIHLRIVGMLMLALIALNFVVARRYRWREETRRLTLFTRQIFWVHSAFICIFLAMMSAVSIALGHDLLRPDRLARAVLGGLATFWFIRLLVQWLAYDTSLWRGKRFETTVHLIFTALWTYFAATYAFALLINLRGVTS